MPLELHIIRATDFVRVDPHGDFDLAASKAALALLAGETAPDVAKGFAHVKAADVGEILETLRTMDHARRGQGEGTFLP
jgi:hypothetical protein